VGDDRREVGYVEAQDAVDLVHLADGDDAGVVDALAGDGAGVNQGLPSREDVRTFGDEHKARREVSSLQLCISRGKTQAIRALRARGEVSELHEVLRAQFKFVPLRVELIDGVVRGLVQRLGRIRESGEDVGVEQIDH
jgi:hypothetical protein